MDAIDLGRLVGYITPSHVTHQRLLLQFLSAPEDGRKERPKHVRNIIAVTNKHTAKLHHVGSFYIYYTLTFALQLRKKHGKTSVQGSFFLIMSNVHVTWRRQWNLQVRFANSKFWTQCLKSQNKIPIKTEDIYEPTCLQMHRHDKTILFCRDTGRLLKFI